MKVLLIEDNKTIANNIKKYLELDNNSVFIAENWLYGLEVAKNNKFDVIVLDLMLPWMNWEDICHEIKKGNDIPIIITTAKWQLEDKLELFKLWADDYLVKPFDLQELEARLIALTKRTMKKNQTITKWDISIDLSSKKIKKDWELIKLTLKEFTILEYLIKNQGIAVSRTDLIQEVRWWDSRFESECDWKLDVYISTIRKKLWKDIIETIKWFGYKINK